MVRSKQVAVPQSHEGRLMVIEPGAQRKGNLFESYPQTGTTNRNHGSTWDGRDPRLARNRGFRDRDAILRKGGPLV
jgi:hypothetical protein